MTSTLAAAEVMTCTFGGEVSGDAGDEVTNTLTVTVSDDEDNTVTDVDTATVTITDVEPTMTVSKTADATEIDEPGGTVTYTVMLSPHGGITSDVTLARFEPDRVVLGGNGPRDLAWLRRHLPTDGSVRLQAVTTTRTCLGLWGYAAREILAPITEADLSSAAFPYLGAQRIRVAGIWVDAARISYAGELGWELSCGAACFNLELAALAKGYAAGWVTGWAAYSPIVLAAFGAPPERIAGFFFLGTSGAELEERMRPDFAEVVSEWRADPASLRDPT